MLVLVLRLVLALVNVRVSARARVRVRVSVRVSSRNTARPMKAIKSPAAPTPKGLGLVLALVSVVSARVKVSVKY